MSELGIIFAVMAATWMYGFIESDGFPQEVAGTAFIMFSAAAAFCGMVGAR